MKEFNEKQYLYLECLADFLDYGNLAYFPGRLRIEPYGIVKYCCDIRFKIDDWNSSSHYESGNNEYVFRNVSRMIL